MKQKHWLTRSRSEHSRARRATNSEARLIHYHLAGLYSMKAHRAGVPLPLHIAEPDEGPEQPPAAELRHPLKMEAS
jgi:hypothetical protein